MKMEARRKKIPKNKAPKTPGMIAMKTATVRRKATIMKGKNRLLSTPFTASGQNPLQITDDE